ACYQFASLMTFPPVLRVAVLYLVALAALTIPAELRAQSTLIPLTTRQAMVFDHASKYLYITTSTGLVQRYNVSANQIDKSYNLDVSVNGVDIALYDSFLPVAQPYTSETYVYLQ